MKCTRCRAEFKARRGKFWCDACVEAMKNPPKPNPATDYQMPPLWGLTTIPHTTANDRKRRESEEAQRKKGLIP